MIHFPIIIIITAWLTSFSLPFLSLCAWMVYRVIINSVFKKTCQKSKEFFGVLLLTWSCQLIKCGTTGITLFIDKNMIYYSVFIRNWKWNDKISPNKEIHVFCTELNILSFKHALPVISILTAFKSCCWRGLGQSRRTKVKKETKYIWYA